MFRIILLASSFASFVNTLQFIECSSNPAISVNSIDITPMPLRYPGDMTFSLNATVKRKIDQLFMHKKLLQLSGVLSDGHNGQPVEVPCFNASDDHLGSCNGIDVCSFMENITNGLPSTSYSLVGQIFEILVHALGLNVQCPIYPKQVVINNYRSHTPFEKTNDLALMHGDYELTVMLKEDPKAHETIGCVLVKFSIDTASPGIVG